MRVGQPFGIRYGEEQYTQEPKKSISLHVKGKKLNIDILKQF